MANVADLAETAIGAKAAARLPIFPASSQPIAPVYSPRGVLSSVSINCIVRCFGAPVIDPHGNSARSTSANDVRARNRASTVDVICQTDA